MDSSKKYYHKLDRRIRASRVFFLGAGFSVAAGIPMTNRLLADSMRLFQEDGYSLFNRVNGYVKECFSLNDSEPDYSEINFSEFCTYLHYKELQEYGGGERWSEQGSRENLALRYYISKAVNNNTPEKKDVPELYIDFANQLVSTDVVVSFNWDCLLEQALDRVKKPYTYFYHPDEDAIWIRKLHGSVNWCWGEPSTTKIKWSALGMEEWHPGKEIYSSDALLSHSTWNQYSPLIELKPFIILPGFGKSFDVRLLAPLWYRPEGMFSSTHHVYIIGLSLAEDDFIIRSLFLDTLPYLARFGETDDREIYVINPDPEIEAVYSFLDQPDYMNFICEEFCSAHVDLMRNTK